MLRISDTEILAPDQYQWVYKVKRQRKRDGKTEFYWRPKSYYPTLEAALHGRVMSCFEPQEFATFKILLSNYNRELKRLSTRLLARLEEDRENAYESAHLAESSGSD
tara:strand:+ start:389 stop:709 length:321 start_codon:yes stop_codon:yes gene_type:complete